MNDDPDVSLHDYETGFGVEIDGVPADASPIIDTYPEIESNPRIVLFLDEDSMEIEKVGESEIKVTARLPTEPLNESE